MPFRSDLAAIGTHVDRLKQFFASLHEKVKSKTCKATNGLIEEGSELIQQLKTSNAID